VSKSERFVGYTFTLEFQPVRDPKGHAPLPSGHTAKLALDWDCKTDMSTKLQNCLDVAPDHMRDLLQKHEAKYHTPPEAIP
jgi:hypothetical protein